MRCASVTVIYAFTGTGTTRGTYTGLTVGAEGVTSCTAAQYVVLSQAEYENAIASPFRLTLAEGGAIAGAILLLWSVGFGIRWAVRAMHTPDPLLTTED
jgi:hypothetical protein